MNESVSLMRMNRLRQILQNQTSAGDNIHHTKPKYNKIPDLAPSKKAGIDKIKGKLVPGIHDRTDFTIYIQDFSVCPFRMKPDLSRTLRDPAFHVYGSANISSI